MVLLKFVVGALAPKFVVGALAAFVVGALAPKCINVGVPVVIVALPH
jgi:hypothetical protein